VCIAANPNEIGIAVPARDNVYVHMVGQSRAGAPAEIDADVKTVGLNSKRKNFLGIPRQFGHFEKLFVIRPVEIRDVPGRRNEQMPVVVREAIHHRDAVFGTPQDKIFVVILRGFDVFTDETLVFVGQALNIADSPRSPEILFSQTDNLQNAFLLIINSFSPRL
jgi:hypothetical protein